MNRAERRAVTKKEIEQGKIFNECVKETAIALSDAFHENPEKIVDWLYSTNPHFGGTCTAAFMLLRPEKYL